jgi:hypothetical protein
MSTLLLFLSAMTISFADANGQRRERVGSFAQGGERGEKKLEAERGRVKNLFPEKAVEEILHCVQE